MIIHTVFEGQNIELDTADLPNGKEIEETVCSGLGKFTHLEFPATGEHISLPSIDALTRANMEDSIREATRILAAAHQHKFTYALNNNHTALRGCECGIAFVGLMAGPSTSQLVWHQIHEENEQQQ